MVKQPSVLLLDEPLGALDLKLRKAMQIELKAIQERLGITFIYVTHDQEEALTMSDRIAVMRAGEICQVGPPEEIYDRPASRYVADFVGAANTLPCEVVHAEGSTYEVDVRGVKTQALGAPGLDPGRAGFLIVRPEHCEVAAAGGSGLAGTVSEILFQGFYHSDPVKLADGSSVSAAQPHRPGGSRSWSVGDEVNVRWVDTEAWVVGKSERDAQRVVFSGDQDGRVPVWGPGARDGVAGHRRQRTGRWHGRRVCDLSRHV